MGKSRIDLYIVVDNSSAAISQPNILQSFSQLLREVFESLSEEIEVTAIWTFDNTPTLRCEHIPLSSFEESLISGVKGGMSNAHLALKKIARHIDLSTDQLNLVLLFLATDTTDSVRLLSDKEKDSLQSISKILVKNSQQINCPDGFKGSNEYLLQDDEEAQKLIEDLKGIITKDSISTNQETLAEEPELPSSPVLSFSDQRDDELQPPEYYQYD